MIPLMIIYWPGSYHGRSCTCLRQTTRTQMGKKGHIQSGERWSIVKLQCFFHPEAFMMLYHCASTKGSTGSNLQVAMIRKGVESWAWCPTVWRLRSDKFMRWRSRGHGWRQVTRVLTCMSLNLYGRRWGAPETSNLPAVSKFRYNRYKTDTRSECQVSYNHPAHGLLRSGTTLIWDSRWEGFKHNYIRDSNV